MAKNQVTYGGGLEESRWIIPQDDRQSPKTEAPGVCWFSGLEDSGHRAHSFATLHDRKGREQKGEG